LTLHLKFYAGVFFVAFRTPAHVGLVTARDQVMCLKEQTWHGVGEVVATASCDSPMRE
jgi:hypothetical protein